MTAPQDRPWFEVSINGRACDVGFWYPDRDEPSTLRVALYDVRAADDIRISYDFERDGWSIQQASKWEWAIDDTEHDEDWQEVAFVQAWARVPISPPDDPVP